MKKQSQIQIVDAKRSGTIKGGARAFDVVITSKKKLPAYRVKSVGRNGETLQTSEVLNTPAAVKLHIGAMKECWGSREFAGNVCDHTKGQKFAAKGWANPKTAKK